MSQSVVGAVHHYVYVYSDCLPPEDEDTFYSRPDSLTILINNVGVIQKRVTSTFCYCCYWAHYV